MPYFQKYKQRVKILSDFNTIRRLRVAKKTCLTGPLKYKYYGMFVLVLGVICALQSAVFG